VKDQPEDPRVAESMMIDEEMYRHGISGETLKAPGEPDVEVSAEPQAEVRFISDGDSGAAGESSG
jgi:hypothetical protein